MPTEINSEHLDFLIEDLTDVHVIKIGRWLKNLFHMYIAVSNTKTERRELWHFDSQHGEWEFYDENNTKLIDHNFESAKLDEFFESKPAYEIQSVRILDGKEIIFYFTDKTWVRTFSEDGSLSEDKYNIWMLDMPSREVIVMDSCFDITLYEAGEDTNSY